MIRNCPNCAMQIMYTSERSYRLACKRKSYCKSCRSRARRAQQTICSDETRKKMSLSHRGEKNHFFGQKHSEESRRKIGEATLNRDQSGNRNPFYGHVHSNTTRACMSESRAAGLASGTIINVNRYGRKSWYVSIKSGVKERCDSLLEKFRMTQLDTDLTVKSWTKKHDIKIPYVFKDVSRHFVPDFLITLTSGEVILEEVKGYDVKTSEKHQALTTYCSTHGLTPRWVTQTELETQGYSQFKKEDR